MRKKGYLDRFVPGGFFHVFNRTNHRGLMFKTTEHRKFFLDQYEVFLIDYVDTYAWCLMGNHFHFLIRVKSEEEIFEKLQQIPADERIKTQQKFLESVEGDRDYHSIVKMQFTRLFTVYAMMFNCAHGCTGNLFYRPFKRVEVKTENHLLWLVYYIHSNPRKHKILRVFSRYKWSSYTTFLSKKKTKLRRQEVLEWFGGIENFISFHTRDQESPDITELEP
jgi:REP element-mobilizing transposase RayT